MLGPFLGARWLDENGTLESKTKERCREGMEMERVDEVDRLDEEDMADEEDRSYEVQAEEDEGELVGKHFKDTELELLDGD